MATTGGETCRFDCANRCLYTFQSPLIEGKNNNKGKLLEKHGHRPHSVMQGEGENM